MATNTHALVELFIPKLDLTFHIQEISSHRYSISADYEFRLVGVTAESIRFIYTNLSAKLQWQVGNQTQTIHGVIENVVEKGASAIGFIYEFNLASPLHILKFSKTQRIFQNQSVIEIIDEILKAAGWNNFQYRISSNTPYPKLDYVVQYNETDFNFLMRMLARWGLLFIWQENSSLSILQMTDDLMLLTLKNHSFSFSEAGGFNRQDSSIFDMTESCHTLVQSIVLRDKNPDEPQTKLAVKINNATTVSGAGEFENYGYHYTNSEEGEMLAKILLRQVNWQRQLYLAKTDSLILLPGEILQIQRHPDQALNRSYRVVTMDINFKQGEWQVALTLIPNEIPYASLSELSQALGNNDIDLETPNFSGLLCACVASICDDDNTPYLDEQGRYFLRFYFDSHTSPLTQCSKPIRRIQPYGGISAGLQTYGSHYPLYPGVDVAVACVRGNLNRPVMIGALPNTKSPSPVNSNNKTQHCLITKVGHSLIMDDYQEKQQIEMFTCEADNYLQINAEALKHQIKLQTKKGELEAFAEQNIFLMCKQSQLVSVLGRQHIVVKGDQTLKTEQASHNVVAGHDLRHQANRDILLSTQGEHIRVESGAGIRVEVSQSYHQIVQTDNYQIKVKEGTTHFYAENVTLNSSLHGCVSLGTEQGFIKITQNQDLRISGQHLLLEAENIEIVALADSPNHAGK